MWVVEQELRARLVAIQTSLTPTERTRTIQIQLSPISFLPSEILIYIFRLGLDKVPQSAHELLLPVAVTGVCRGWRAVALRTPELWTRVFVTSATPIYLLQTYLDRSRDSEMDVSFCHWPIPKRCNEVNSSEAFLELIVGTLCHHVHRLRRLSIWDVSDTVVCTAIGALLNFYTPRLTSVFVKANQTTYDQYYELRNAHLLPFLSGGAPSLTHLVIHHFPIETFRMRSDWSFHARNLASITLRTQEWPVLGVLLPPYLIEFPALCALLRSTPNLVTLALYGPVVEPDEDFPTRPLRVTLPSLKTLIIHRRVPGVRYHCELLNVLKMPALKRLDVPWHDDLTVEPPYADHAATYLFDEEGRPRFASVKTLYLRDSAVRRMMPTRTFMKAFPNVEKVILGGTDVAKFAATLRGFVLSHTAPVSGVRSARAGRRALLEREPEGVLAEGAWERVRRIVLKDPDMARWKGWVRGFCKWLAAGGHTSRMLCVEIQGGVLHGDELDECEKKAFRRGLERLGQYARVVVV